MYKESLGKVGTKVETVACLCVKVCAAKLTHKVRYWVALTAARADSKIIRYQAQNT